jgi:hypothetical protein
MKHSSRRIILQRSGLAAMAATFGVAFAVTKARADDLVTKDSVSYQTTPSGGNQCSKCKSFIPGSSASADGTCKVVQGSISSTGYCVAFSPV